MAAVRSVAHPPACVPRMHTCRDDLPCPHPPVLVAAVILALRDIQAGEEVTLSYIGAGGGLRSC